MDSTQQYSLRWNNYLNHITDAFGSLRTVEDLVDVTLSCEGKKIRAHKMLLSACSSYFRDLFKENPCQHPVIIFRNVKYDDLVSIIDFMYQGEVSVVQEQLASFLATAELLAIKGLTDGSGGEKSSLMEPEEALSSPTPVEIEDELEPVADKPVVSSSQNIVPANKRLAASPQQRKRKHSVQCVPPTPPNNFLDKKLCVTLSSNSIQNDDGDEPIEVIPVFPKVEKQEYNDGYDDIADQTQSALGPLQTILRNCDTNVKCSAAEYNSVNSSSSLQDVTSDEIIDMEQVLMEPGTSSEILPQDSLQVEKVQDISELSCDQTEETRIVDYTGETTTVKETQAELEEDGYLCELCRQEKKVVSDFTSHKCPICSEDLFCSHQLKAHMKIVHGWFTVQRRFQPHLV